MLLNLISTAFPTPVITVLPAAIFPCLLNTRGWTAPFFAAWCCRKLAVFCGIWHGPLWRPTVALSMISSLRGARVVSGSFHPLVDLTGFNIPAVPISPIRDERSSIIKFAENTSGKRRPRALDLACVSIGEDIDTGLMFVLYPYRIPMFPISLPLISLCSTLCFDGNRLPYPRRHTLSTKGAGTIHLLFLRTSVSPNGWGLDETL